MLKPEKAKRARVTGVMARIVKHSQGIAVEPLDSKGSAELASGRFADGVIVVPAGSKEISAGSVVEFRTWRTLL